jgi:phasin family protein
MFSFPESSLSDAVKAQLNAQFSFFAQFSDQMLDGIQKMNRLNAQVARTLFDESLAGAQQFFGSDDPYRTVSSAAGQSQPAVEKIRAYQQHVQNIVAETQAGIAKVVETHMPETTRASETLVKEATQKATEEAAKATQRHKEVIEKMTMPFNSGAERGGQGGAPKPTH